VTFPQLQLTQARPGFLQAKLAVERGHVNKFMVRLISQDRTRANQADYRRAFLLFLLDYVDRPRRCHYDREGTDLKIPIRKLTALSS
jgi:hypothetical protein